MAGLDHDILKLQPDWLDSERPRLGRYVLGPLLGRGGMGEVVEAWDVVLCRTVALKVLKNLEATAVIRFMHEAQIQARIVHPNICRIYDVDASEGNVKIAMQLVRGPNLEQAARDLSITEVVSLMAQVAEAIHAAHRLKLIHRDLKPSNILLERGEDGRWFPYICDFGLAMAMDEPSLTYTNSVLGTPAYMAPEQLRGQRDQVGPATDVYGLGGTLHFALLGWAPDGPTPDAGVSAIGNQPLARPIPRDLPKDLRTIIRKCLEADPELRYHSASALADDLWSLLNGQSIRGTVAGPVARIWRRVRPYRMPVVTVLVVAGTLGVALQVERVRDARVNRAAEEQEWFFAREVADMEQDLRMERMLPIHDLRPAYSRVQGRIERLRTRLADSSAAGPGHLALANLYALLGDADGIRREAALARQAGFRNGEATGLTGFALVLRDATTGISANAQELQELEAGALANQRAGTAANRMNDALLAFLRRDYLRASAEAFSVLQSFPWNGQAAWLEGLSQVAQARRMFDDGDLNGAESRFRDAQAGAEAFLAKVPGQEPVQHVYFLAARGLCRLQLLRDGLAPETLAAYQGRCEKALGLDPGNADLQNDWLALQVLKARLMELHGRDPREVLEAARSYALSRPTQPLGPALRNQQLAVLLHLGMREFSQGGDPRPGLAPAMQDLPAPPSPEFDILPEALVFKARVDLARGADPRPAVAAAVARVAARPEERTSWVASEVAAEAWLLQAEWEAAQRLPAADSLRRAQVLAATAVQMSPRAASALALEGLVCYQQWKLAPGAGPGLLLQARDRLRQSRTLVAGGPLQARLAGLLATAPAGGGQDD